MVKHCPDGRKGLRHGVTPLSFPDIEIMTRCALRGYIMMMPKVVFGLKLPRPISGFVRISAEGMHPKAEKEEYSSRGAAIGVC
jgi:hypothetical protein